MASNKQSLTIRLTPEVLERLDRITEHLGVNRSSYMTQAVGERLSRDEQSFSVKKLSSDMGEDMKRMFDHLIEDKQHDND